MIRYRHGRSWLRLVLYYWGGVNRHIFKPTGYYLAFVGLLWAVQVEYQVYTKLNKHSLNSFGAFVVFLLVFRVNQAMARFNEGSQLSTELFSELESLIFTFCTCMRGANSDQAMVLKGSSGSVPKDTFGEEMATVAKLNCVRLVVAFGIAFIMHCRLEEGASNFAGQLTENSVEHLVFLHCRLQSLLYMEELEVVNNALCVLCERCDSGRSRFYADVRRHRLTRQEADEYGHPTLEPIFGSVDGNCAIKERLLGANRGSPTAGSPAAGSTAGGSPAAKSKREEGHSVTALPHVLMIMISDLIQLPLEKDWGYPQRALNILDQKCTSVMRHVGLLNCLIGIGVPLAYFQHCRVLLLIYAFLSPFSVDPDSGFMNNMVLPFVIFWAVMGLEVLAEMLENPLGDDDTDLDLMRYVHNLEVYAQYAFDMTETHRARTRQAMLRPLHDFGMTSRDHFPMPEHDSSKRPFSEFFHWMPIPTTVLDSLFRLHGDVDIMHQIWITSSSLSFRNVLRQAYRSRNGAVYHAVESETDNETSQTLRRDPNLYAYYLVFKGVIISGNQKGRLELEWHDVWKEHATRMLRCHKALAMLKDDTERSLLRIEPDNIPGINHIRKATAASEELRGTFQKNQVAALSLPSASTTESISTAPNSHNARILCSKQSGVASCLHFERSVPPSPRLNGSLLLNQ